MKKELVGYIEAMINEQSRGLKLMKEHNYTKDAISLTKQWECSLDDLLEYIEDIPDKATDAAENNARYVTRIQELEKQHIELNKENEELVEACNQLSLKNPISITLSTSYELEELKSKLTAKEEVITGLNYQLTPLTLEKADYKERFENLQKSYRYLQQECKDINVKLAKAIGPKWVD